MACLRAACPLVLMALWGHSLAAQQSPTLPTPTIAARVTPATVTILTFGAEGDTLSQGSGFVVRPSGVIVTNWHVLVGAHSATVLLESGERYDRVLFLDGDSTQDVALIQVPGAGLPALATRDDLPPVGSRVVVIGSPFGLSQTVTEGVVSAIRVVKGQSLVQISAPISHGSSGAPVLDDRGRAFAIASASLAEGQQLNFSVPLRYAMRLLSFNPTPRPLTSAPTSGATRRAAARTSRQGQDTKIGDFYFVSDKDPIDDTDRSFAATPAVNPTSTRVVGLGWKCYEDGLNVVLTLGQFFGGDDDGRILVRYRIDASQPSEEHYWTLFQDNEIAYMPMTSVAEFTARAKQGRKVFIRITDPLDGETHTYEFSLRGLTRALDRVLPCRATSIPSMTRVPAASVPVVRVGETVNASLTSSDSLYPDKSYFKFYQFTATAGEHVTIDLASDDFDPVLIVSGDDLDNSLIDDDGGPGCSARVSRTFPSSGRYRILVNTTATPERQTGRFTLSITQGSKPVQEQGNRDCRVSAAEHTIGIGQSQQGMLTSDDVLLDADSTYAQPWTIQGRAGQTITIDLESDDFDPYVFLRGPGLSGSRDFQDDDSGGNCNARLTATFAETGEYEIDVNTADSYATGSFTISVTSGSKPKSVTRCTRR